MKTEYISLVDAYTILSEANKNILMTCDNDEKKIEQIKCYQSAMIKLGEKEIISIANFRKVFETLFPTQLSEDNENNKVKSKKM